MNTNDLVISTSLKPDETALTNTVHNNTVRRLFSLLIAIIYHGFTVIIILTASWYYGRNVGYSYII